MTIVRDLPGIRVVRPLARDAHRETWLVQLEGEQPGPAVLVRPCDAHGARMVRVEAIALHRGEGVGLVPLIDVVGDPYGAALVREHCVGPRLATVLAERERWEAGEVVSVLRPVTEALARLHGRGVAHGAFGAAEIVVTASGGMLVELAAAELFGPGSPEAVLARLDAIARDRDAVRNLASELLRRVAGSRSRAAHSLADDVDQVAAAELLSALRSGLDDLAAPVPVEREDAPEAPEQAAAPASRLIPVVRVDGDAPSGAESAAAGGGWRATALSWLHALRSRLDALPSARRRLVVAGGAAITAAAVLLALPYGGEASGPHAPDHHEPPGATESAASAPSDTSITAAGSTADNAAIEGDDPLAAAIALLERRATCFAQLSLLCLESVDQQGSAALEVDRRAMQALRAGDEARYPVVEAVDARLVERLGDSALVQLGPQTAPASLLLMRSEAGWRIRDWVAGVD